jgi:hypothetical protein
MAAKISHQKNEHAGPLGARPEQIEGVIRGPLLPKFFSGES